MVVTKRLAAVFKSSLLTSNHLEKPFRHADSTAAAAGLAAADARSIAPVAMVKANVPNTPLLPVTIFMPASPVVKEIGTGGFRDQ
jgi:hypothetical protein